jgi:hypothetical protein
VVLAQPRDSKVEICVDPKGNSVSAPRPCFSSSSVASRLDVAEAASNVPSLGIYLAIGWGRACEGSGVHEEHAASHVVQEHHPPPLAETLKS